MDQGFIKLSRKFFTNPFWNEDRMFSKCEAWLDMIQAARFEQSSAIVNGKVIELQRGELCASIRYLAKRWSWGEQKVRTYIILCKNQGMITQRQHSGETIITLVKYGIFNDRQHSNEPESNTGITQGQHRDNTGVTQSIRKKEGKEVKKERIKEEVSPPALSDFLNYCETQLPKDFFLKKSGLELKFNAWVENGWKDGHDKPIKNWKSKILNTIPFIKNTEITKSSFENRVESMDKAGKMAMQIAQQKEKEKYN